VVDVGFVSAVRGIASCGSISAEERAKVKIPTLPNSGEGWGTLQFVQIEIVGSITPDRWATATHPLGMTEQGVNTGFQ
jgi:hypothetical protein